MNCANVFQYALYSKHIPIQFECHTKYNGDFIIHITCFITEKKKKMEENFTKA